MSNATVMVVSTVLVPWSLEVLGWYGFTDLATQACAA